ncbi:MAG: sigma-70 family RNA polymerase sigma factor [Bacteriovoracaceae bacterium]|nr:sigma-70 family RNA polymerase sigma factor [Bacteriovoracaceae bacterium]
MQTKEQWFQEVVRSYEGALLRYTRKITGDLEAAREVVQEALLKLWKQTHAKVKDHIPQWLYVVCRNLAIDRLRKNKGTMELNEDEHFSLTNLPEEELLKTEVFEQLLKLKEAYQEVIILKFQEGRSYKEIAEITGHSVSNVGVLIHEGMKILRAKFEEATNE